MQRLPLWKLKRELSRAAANFMAGPSYFAQYLMATPYHDWILARRRLTYPGALSMHKRIAVYLIFPKHGVLPTHMRAISYLLQNGYAPLVVSNAPLSQSDLTRLLAVSARVIVRQNFGYDFGGYRDAVLSLGSQIATLDRLVLLNDSTWFPLPGAMNWLAEAEALAVDYAAAAWTGAVARPAPTEFEKIEWRVDKTRRNFHYASFALGFSNRILRDPTFRRFWRGFRLTQDKHHTVRRGEIGLTVWVMRNGYSHAATTELADLGEILNGMTESQIALLFDRVIVLSDPEMDAIRKRLQKARHIGQADRQQIIKFILMIVARRGASYALSDYLVRNQRFAFLKKSPAALDDSSVDTIADIARHLAGGIGDEILAEIGKADPHSDQPPCLAETGKAGLV